VANATCAKETKPDKSQNTSKDSFFLLAIRDDACYRQNTFSNRNVILLWLCSVPAGCLGIHFFFLKCTRHSPSQLTGLEMREMSNQGTCLGPWDTESSSKRHLPRTLPLALASLRQLPDNMSEVFQDVSEVKTSPFFLLHGETANLFPPQSAEAVLVHFLKAQHSPQQSKILLEFND